MKERAFGARVQRVQRVQKVQKVLVGGCAAIMNKNFKTALTGEGKQANHAFGMMEMYPYPRLRRYFPRRGKF